MIVKNNEKIWSLASDIEEKSVRLELKEFKGA